MDQPDQPDKSENRNRMPAVAALIAAHRELFGDGCVVLRCIDYTTNTRGTQKNEIPYELLSDEDFETKLNSSNGEAEEI